ncbi:membrane protease subunit HflC [Caulobacter ginsengisoli]|uniref:Protein HflC n=1 Tax=Caulobacter ginsengisoli TaxID=400775 RepID=A0ABU0INV4_9CAUL|nr:protease modulator HflC [Caulobacter ginsengisoli]MDQ0463639.1 membrane protease subunit HflC [Caulobacter ginsengisoli]
MNRNTLTGWAVGGLLFVVLLANSLFVIDQTEQAVVVRLGDPARIVNGPGGDGPGLKLKVPFLENVVRFDKRNIGAERDAGEITAGNQERLVVDAYIRYRIVDPQAFYQQLHNTTDAEQTLGLMVTSSLKKALGRVPSQEIISSRRAEVMQITKEDLKRQAERSRLGIEIIDVRIKRADLPKSNADAVFERMKSNRQQEAAAFRAGGAQQAQQILGKATEEAETIRGQADADRARIFAASYGQDPGFAAFYRSMKAYEQSLAGGNTTLVLSPDSAFFKYFSQGPGG